jgi:hypothetical protein
MLVSMVPHPEPASGSDTNRSLPVGSRDVGKSRGRPLVNRRDGEDELAGDCKEQGLQQGAIHLLADPNSCRRMEQSAKNKPCPA